MVVPAREPASLGTSHGPALPMNVVVRRGRREGKRPSRCCLSTLIRYGSLKVSSINAFLRLDCRSGAGNSLE